LDYDDIEMLTPRRRRALRWIALAVLVLAAIALGLHLAGRSRLDALRREQARHGPLDPAAHAPPVAPDEENAARALLAAGAGIERLPDDFHHLRSANGRPAAWPPEVRAAVERHLAANAEPLAALHRAAALPGGGLGLDYAHPNPLATTRPVHLFAAIRLLELAGHRAVAAGEPEAAAAAVATLGRMAGLLHAEPEPLLQAVAAAVTGGQLRVLRELLAAGAPPALLPDLAAALGEGGGRAALARAVHRQTVLFLGEDAHGFAVGLGRQEGGLWHPAAWLAGELLIAEGLRGPAALVRVDRLPYRELVAAVEAAESDLPLGPFADLHVGLQATALRADAAAAAHQLGELAVALAAAAARDGRYPPDLAALAPPHPAATTPDPLTGSLPAYRLAADGSAALALEAAEAKAGSALSLDSVPFAWTLPSPG
jgi:hypothetical protein